MKNYKIAVDETILIKDEICSAGSKMLYNFKSPYSAAVIEKLKTAGFEISSKSKTSEFGSTREHGEANIILGIDIGGEAYNYASKNGFYYIKPTYGTVSRFGLVANVSSIDQIGVYAKNLDDGFEILSVIAGHDKNDGTTYPELKYEYKPSPETLKTAEFKAGDFKYSAYFTSVYCIVQTAEFCNNINRFDGLKFGYRTKNFKNYDDIVINSRSEAFTTETKLKALMGTYVLSEGQYKKYYHKAMQVRRLIKQETDEIFNKYDIIELPLCEETAALINLTGNPALVAGKKIITAKQFGENKLYSFGRES